MAVANRPNHGRIKFRLWLEAMVVKGEINGLRWWNREKRTVRIPWKIGGQQDSQPEDGRIFMEWARYTGIYREGIDRPDYPEWRRIFRVRLHGSRYIEEVKSESQRLCRVDPFRVYILMKPKRPNDEAQVIKHCTTLYKHNPQGPLALEAQHPLPAAAGDTCQKQPQTVEALMDTPTVRDIFEMGFSKDLIKTLIETQLATTGHGFPNADSLLDAIFQLETSGTGLAPVALSAAPSLPDTKNENSNTGILEDNHQLREVKLCKVCMESDLNTAFMPCGHAVCCLRCSARLHNCPICQSVIRKTMKIFLS